MLRPYFGYNAALMVLYLIDWIPYVIPQTRETAKQVLKHIFGVFYSEGVILFSDTTPSLHFFTSYNYPLWFLTAMVTASGAFLLLLLLRRKFGWKLRYMIVPCLLMTIALNHLPLRLPWNFNNCFLAAALMAAGYGIRQINLLERQWNHKWMEPVWLHCRRRIGGLHRHLERRHVHLHAHERLRPPWRLGPGDLLHRRRDRPRDAAAVPVLEGRKISHVLMALGQNTIPILAPASDDHHLL